VIRGVACRLEAIRLAPNPAYELCHFRMRPEQWQCVELSLERFLGEERVNVVVTGPAKPGQPMLHLLPVKFAFVSLVRVARFGNEVMLGQKIHRPST
jgi:hypothetical protein